ncbi:winged helix-turn-helix domain-containing protein [Actinoplanes sp. NPDC089786]|uniref:BTAD domain-containing putative transcriptional regulator n=1 Tax=Actinoplanes sp. NPDC089786 TaxID=3155185 RepID=UPI003417D637
MSTGPLQRHPTRVGLLRPRLIDALGGLRTARLAIVAAPAGTGKTTLLAQYAHGWPGAVGWWQVEPGNATVDAVVSGVWRAVGGQGADERPRSLDELAGRLAAAPPDEHLLIIDDLHYLNGTDAEAALEALILRAPGALRVLIGTRRMPGFNLARHEFSSTTVVSAEDLRFRSWEVEYLLSDVYREPLPPDDVAALTRRLNGWAAGVHMFHLSTGARSLAERRRAIAALDGRSALTRGYLARTVLAELPADLREFMVRTCVFETLTAARCERLLDHPGHSARLLAELDRRQAFTSTSDGGQTYRYHDVLRAHLGGTLAEELGEAGARAWHARAAEQLVAEGARVEGARAYARAEEWAKVRGLLDELGGQVAEEDIEPWRELLPGWLVAGDPWLIYAEARQLLGRGRLTGAVERLRQAEEHMGDERSRSPVRALRHAIAVWLPGGHAPAGPGLGRLRSAVRGHPALTASTSADQPLVAALAHLIAGNVAEVRRTLPERSPEAADLPELGARLLDAVLATSGRHPEAKAWLAAVLADAERARLPWLVRLTRAGAALSGDADALADARAVIRECDRDADEWGAVLALGMICLARSLAAEPDAADVDDAAAWLERCREVDAAALAAWAQSLLALAAARNSLADAELEAQRADALARSAGVPGARVAALAAAARCGATRADVPALAVECGLPAAVAAAWAGNAAGRATADEPPEIEVWCLGGFRIRRRGVELDLSLIKPRTRAALRLLATYAGRPVHRENLIEALWPDMPIAQATRSLQVALSSLRTFLEPGLGRGQSELIVRHGEAYELALPRGGVSDVARFRAALGEAQRCELAEDTPGRRYALRVALHAYGGELLPEDGPAEWVVPERALLQRHAAEAAADLARLQLDAGAVSDAMLTARRCVEIDRYSDPGWRLLIEACELVPSPAAAARAKRGYADMLASLGITAGPSETLVRNAS